MKASLSSFTYIRYPLEEAIDRTSKTGFKALEIVANRPHMFPPDYSESDRKRIASQVHSLKMEVAAITSFNGTPHWLFSHPNRAVREDTVNHVKNCIDLAGDLNCKVVEVVTGTPVLFGTRETDAWGWVKECLERCTDHAKSSKRVIGLEAEPGNTISSTDQAARMIEEIDSSSLQFLIDIGHINVGKEDIRESILKTKGKLAHVHIHDNDGTSDQHLIPGDGKIDFKPIVQTLRDIRYDGFVSAELEQRQGDASATRMRDFFKSFFEL